MIEDVQRSYAAHKVANALKKNGVQEPETKLIVDLLGDLGITRNDAAMAVPMVRALLSDDPDVRASKVPMTVANLIEVLSKWPQHATVHVPDGSGGTQALTDLDVQTAHAAFTSPVLVVRPAMRAPELDAGS